MPAHRLTIVGIGADGWAGLSGEARLALTQAQVVLGSARQLELLDSGVTAERQPWPSPLVPALPAVLAELSDRQVAVLASGDPMFYGIGSTIARLLEPDAMQVIPQVSSMSLACARLHWAQEDVELVSLVGRALPSVHPAIQPGNRLLILVSEAEAVSSVCELLVHRGYGDSTVTALERLGAADERLTSTTAREWAGPTDPLTVLAVHCSGGELPELPRTPGLPDDAFVTDGQLTKRELRALALSALAPRPHQLLWDVGAGSGSVGVEWMRTHPSCAAIAIEAREDRLALIGTNSVALGVPGLQVVLGTAPQALEALATPDAIFAGGAVSVPGVLELCVQRLRPGGRLVAHAVTLEGESVLAGWHSRLGGALTRVSIERAGPIGGFTGWRPAMAVTQWSYRKDHR